MVFVLIYKTAEINVILLLGRIHIKYVNSFLVIGVVIVELGVGLSSIVH